MKIKTLWTYHQGHAGDPVLPELVLALDEATLEEAPEAWPAEKARVVARYEGYGLERFRELDIEVPDLWETAKALFLPAKTTGHVKEDGRQG